LLGISYYSGIDDFFERNPDADVWLFTTKANKLYTDADFSDNCYMMFGKETAGLPEELRERFPDRCVRIPMLDNPDARSLNLATSAAVALYEAIRQTNYKL
jgi:tRNA (cytidine/uridine-2'-O-)-methyltransferase